MDQVVARDSDLRGCLQGLEEAGELQQVDSEVDPHLTVGAISQRLAERGGPATHFKNVQGAKHGITLVSGVLARGSLGLWSKFAVALGMDPKSEYRDVLEEVTRRVESPIRPLQVASGLCKEITIGKNDVDLESLAAPTLHDGDGGRYLTSWAFMVVADPDSNYVAWDLVPLMVMSKNTLSGHLSTDTNVGRIFRDKYAKSGKPMPFAIVFGGGPMATVAAVFRRGRSGFTDPEVAGSLQRSPIQLVKCETSDLLVPANAEMILEGIAHSDKMVRSGPFASSFGYRTSAQDEGPEFEVVEADPRRIKRLRVRVHGTINGSTGA